MRTRQHPLIDDLAFLVDQRLTTAELGRFRRLFRETWSQLPRRATLEMLHATRSAPKVVLNWRIAPVVYQGKKITPRGCFWPAGSVRGPESILEFSSDAVETATDEEARGLIRHELGHALLFAEQGWPACADENAVATLVKRWEDSAGETQKQPAADEPGTRRREGK